MLASISGIDLTPRIQGSTYLMDSYDVCDTWEDASGKNHERLYRTRVKGSFEMVYVTDGTGVHQLWDLIEGARRGRVLKITVFVNNLCVTKEIDCHYVVTGVNRVDLRNGLFKDRIKITLEEI